MDDRLPYLILAQAGLNGYHLQRLAPHCSVTELCRQPISTLRALGLTERQALAIHTPSAQALQQAEAWLAADDAHHLISFDDGRYPALLKQTRQPPLLLFVAGNPAILSQPQLAMVGSRQPSPTGKRIAFDFAAELVRHGYVVTSGMARGIDSCAHQGALSIAGPTIAVLGHGLTRIYPKSNQALAEQIRQQGALVTEYFPQVDARPAHFPQRNRIVVGLSQGTLVVEAALKSGSLISAHLAVDANRDVFAIPGSIYHPQSAGCHALIQQGAKLTTCVADILEEWTFSAKSGLKQQQSEKNTTPDLFDDTLLANVGDEATAVDLIAERSELSVADTTIALLQLELAGLVAVVPGGYIRVRST
ncbi:DNA-processing protein DprA [Alkalimonas delamerensis]|uniref:DNA-processing protein DprA n=1 Tax=Alkalimonas delamerensis TaxID=265981 RepID=A0ABT9GUA6_9GAMM|nr:DNA-processing protein DprA [Alkalimonas delamerensis]MDP4530216.1 DNA-processing protein DprA [Alkalimonas delamerensis]